MSGKTFVSFNKIGLPLALVSTLALTACDENGEFAFPTMDRAAPNESDVASAQSERPTQMTERDVEAPEAFQVKEDGLWDGRPSLGGVWVAHPDVTEPERVIIRNQENGSFVIGALFRRERENPGPALQVSSDAAAALEMLAGAPTELEVTALRREEAPVEEPVAAFDIPEGIAPAPVESTSLDGADLPAPEAPALEANLPAVETTAPQLAVPAALSAPISAAASATSAAASATTTAADVATAATPDPIAAAAAAIEAAAAEASANAEETAPAPASAAPASENLDKPFIQIGIFSIEENANSTAERMRSGGIVPIVQEQSSQGRTFWRVVVGPARTVAERDQLLAQLEEQGFQDTFFVSN